MEVCINVRDYRDRLRLWGKVPNFPMRKLNDRRRYRILHSRLHYKPIEISSAWIELGKRVLIVISDPSGDIWHPLVMKEGAPLLIWNLVDRHYLERRFLNPKLWRGKND